MASIRKRPNGRWRARYRDEAGREHAQHFDRKIDAQNWLDEQTASLVSGTWISPKDRKITVDEWCDRWIAGYGSRRESTVAQAKVHLGKIRDEFGQLQLSAVRPSLIKTWCAQLQAHGHEPSYVYALHSRLSQVMSDAVLDGVLASNPCSRRTSPSTGSQRPYVATTDQVFALYESLPERYRVAVLLGAFSGLRIAEVCGLRVADVGFLRREINPAVQYPANELKTETSRMAIPIADSLVRELSAQVSRWPGEHILTEDNGDQVGPWKIEREIRRCRGGTDGLPVAFRFQDLRHYFASLLITSGADVKVVQARLRHAKASTTLDTYGHLWPDKDESTRSASEAVLSTKIKSCADSMRTADRVDF